MWFRKPPVQTFQVYYRTPTTWGWKSVSARTKEVAEEEFRKLGLMAIYTKVYSEQEFADNKILQE